MHGFKMRNKYKALTTEGKSVEGLSSLACSNKTESRCLLQSTPILEPVWRTDECFISGYPGYEGTPGEFLGKAHSFARIAAVQAKLNIRIVACRYLNRGALHYYCLHVKC